jgi:hypothetical protein
MQERYLRKVPSSPASRAASRRSRSASFCSLSGLDLRSLEANAIGSLPLLADPVLQYARRAKAVAQFNYAAEVANAIGSTIKGSSFSSLLTLVEIGHIRMGSAGNGRIKSRGSGSSLSQRT